MFRISDEEWERDRKELKVLQYESESGDFSFSYRDRAAAYVEILKQRRAAPPAGRDTKKKAPPTDSPPGVETAAASADTNRQPPTDEKKPSRLTLASARARSLILRARPDAGHTCDGSSAEEPATPDPARHVGPAATEPPDPARPAATERPGPRPRKVERVTVVSSDIVHPHDLLLSFLDAIGVDGSNPRVVKQVIRDRQLRRAITKQTNYAAQRFFSLLRSHNVSFWGVDNLRDAGAKILREFRRRHVEIAPLSRSIGLSRMTIRSVGQSRKMRMATLILIGTPVGFLDGRFRENRKRESAPNGQSTT